MIQMKKKISTNFYYYQWVFNTRKLRKNFPKFKILSFNETIRQIIEDKKSISRFGDGEFRLFFPEFALEFQENSDEISKRLKEVASSDLSNHLVCLPEPFYKTKNFDIPTKYWWKKFINVYGKRILPYLNKDKAYGNQFITRFYIGYKDKSDANILDTVSLLKKIWEKQEILIVEGRYSRLGLGNDLFDNSKNLERIICPEKNAFRCYDKILSAVKEHGKNKLVLISLGPTATILAYDLAKAAYWALDVGHIDIEYMWFLMKVKDKVSIRGRHVNETNEQQSLDIPNELKDKYEKSIILEIKE